MPLDIAKEIHDQIEELKERNLQPAFIVLGGRSYLLLSSYVKDCLGVLKLSTFVNEFDNIPVVFVPDAHEFCVRVLPNANDCFLYLQQEESDRTS